MPRPIVLGNGSLLLNIDDRGDIRDLFYPQVGRFNHLSGHRIRMGVWSPERFSWTDEDAWSRRQRYRESALVAETTFENATLGLVLKVTEGVLHDRSVFLRHIGIRSTEPSPRELRLFFTHDLLLAESDIGDTAFYNPFLDAVIHYKGPHWLLFGGSTHLGGIYEYATGIKAFGGFEGTWRDAEDGHLSMNPIAQGSVDSTMSLRLDLKPGAEEEAWYWMVAGSSLDDVQTELHRLTADGLDGLLDTSSQFWAGWSSEAAPQNIGETLSAHLDRSLLIMRTHCDDHGAVMAATDSDIMATNRSNYCYVWPRDGAFVSEVFDRLDKREVSERFFEFCRRALPKTRPVLFQKYGADGTFGASWHPWVVDGQPEMPCQQDETALVLIALCKHLAKQEAGEWVETVVAPIADYLTENRDPVTALPQPSWDLWEERRGVHAFTVATVIAGLRAAAGLVAGQDPQRAARYRTAADETANALGTLLFDGSRGVFFRRLAEGKRDSWEPDPVLDSSVLAVGLLGALPPDDPRVISTADVIEKGLSVRSPVGGIARYSGDYYFRRSEAYPGNPWFICTLWLAQTRILLARTLADLNEPRRWLEWAVRWSASTGVMAEQLHPDTGEPLSVSPLTWSHAEFVKTALDYSDALKKFSGSSE